MVVAETLEQAKDAAELIAVDYEVLPAVVDPVLATRPGAPVLFEAAPDNVEARRDMAVAYEKLGKKSQALKSWAAVRDLAANDAAHVQIATEATAALERLR